MPAALLDPTQSFAGNNHTAPKLAKFACWGSSTIPGAFETSFGEPHLTGHRLSIARGAFGYASSCFVRSSQTYKAFLHHPFEQHACASRASFFSGASCCMRSVCRGAYSGCRADAEMHTSHAKLGGHKKCTQWAHTRNWHTGSCSFHSAAQQNTPCVPPFKHGSQKVCIASSPNTALHSSVYMG